MSRDNTKFTKKFCKRGHDMSKTRIVSPSGRIFCNICKKDSEKRYRKEKPEEYKSKNWKYALKRDYGITPEIYSKMFVEQLGKCNICGNDLIFKNISTAVDHCHKTNKVRGLLCRSCNFGLGFFYDNEKNLKSAISYLLKTKEE